jgi:hypothetical protein
MPIPNKIIINGILPFTTEAVLDDISVIIVVGICITHILSALWQKTNKLPDNVESKRNTSRYEQVRQNIVKNWAGNFAHCR